MIKIGNEKNLYHIWSTNTFSFTVAVQSNPIRLGPMPLKELHQLDVISLQRTDTWLQYVGWEGGKDVNALRCFPFYGEKKLAEDNVKTQLYIYKYLTTEPSQNYNCLLCTSRVWISKDLTLILDSWNQYGIFWNYQPLDMKWHKVKSWVYIAATRNICCLISFLIIYSDGSESEPMS